MITYCHSNSKIMHLKCGLVELIFSSPKLDVIETPVLVDAVPASQPQPPHNHHSIRLRISALSTADIEAVVRDLDTLCAEVICTRTLDADMYGEKIAGLTDMQVLPSRVVNVAVLVLLPIVSAILFEYRLKSRRYFSYAKVCTLQSDGIIKFVHFL